MRVICLDTVSTSIGYEISIKNTLTFLKHYGAKITVAIHRFNRGTNNIRELFRQPVLLEKDTPTYTETVIIAALCNKIVRLGRSLVLSLLQQLFLVQSAMVCYNKVRQLLLLQSATVNVNQCSYNKVESG